MRLKDKIEDVNGNPKVGDTLEMMEKELVKMKAEENHKNSFEKDSKTFYMWNDDSKSRYDNWINDLRSRGYVRSD